MAGLGEFSVDDAVDVPIQLCAQRAIGEMTQPRETGPNDLLDVVDERGLGGAAERWQTSVEKLTEADRRVPSTTFGKRERSHPRDDDATGTRVSRRAGRRWRPCQQKRARRRPVVHGAPDDVPRLRDALPLVNEDRSSPACQP